MSKLARDHRNADLAKIHLAKKALGLDDPQYRSILYAQGQVDSAKDLDHKGRLAVLRYFQTHLGWKPAANPAAPGRRPNRPTPGADALPLVRRIRAQLISLDRKPDEYADGIARQMLGDAAPAFFEWCTPRQLHKISQALGVEQGRRGADDGR